MSLIGFNRKMKGLFCAFLLFFAMGLISLYIADSISMKYNVARQNFVNQIDDKDLSNKEIKKIENALRTINEKFHTSEYVAIYDKKDGVNDVEYFDLDLKDARYLFPMNAEKKENLITEAFYPTEGFDGKNFYIVHRYFPDWHYLFPVGFFAVSSVLLIIWLLFQIKYVYTTRLSKLKFQNE